MEQWRYITGTNEKYMVSNLGKVWNVRKNKECNYHEDRNGYVFVRTNHKNIMQAHQFVLLEFMGPAEGRFVDHIDSNPKNNTFSNLRYVTRKENNKIRDDKLLAFAPLQEYNINTDEEVWVTSSFDNNYEVSSYGQVRRKSKGLLKMQNTSNSPYMVTFSNKGLTKKYSISSLVAQEFLVSKYEYENQIITFKDQDRSNLNVYNLFYAPRNYFKYKHLVQ